MKLRNRTKPDPQPAGEATPTPDPKPERPFLDKLAKDMRDMTERDIVVAVWAYTMAGGLPFRLNWPDTAYMNLGGPQQLAASLATIRRLGFVAILEDPERDQVFITPLL